MELKPCPFCGGDKLKIEFKTRQMYKSDMRGVDPYTVTVRCNKCHARGATVSAYLRNCFKKLSDKAAAVEVTKEMAEKMAIEAWNRRADDGTQTD